MCDTEKTKVIKLDPLYEDDHLSVVCIKPGHEYDIWKKDSEDLSDPLAEVCFQDGPIKEVGINGIQNEPVIAILIDRLNYLDSQFSSPYNKAAIYHLQLALDSLQQRTKDRQDRGVEGTNQE